MTSGKVLAAASFPHFKLTKEYRGITMSSSVTTAVQRFEQRFEELREQGLVDMKFFVGEVNDATAEDFCAEFLVLDSLITEGKTTPLDFGDSTHR